VAVLSGGAEAVTDTSYLTVLMEFEWDEAKAARNLTKHGVSFEEAKTVFEDRLYVDFYDPKHSLNEHRYIIIGQSNQGRILIVSYTERNDAIRLINARGLTAAERQDYEEQ
jgi:uncharacterized protein